MLTVMRRSGQRMAQYIQVLGLQIVQLCKLVKLWPVNFIHIFQNAVTLFLNLLVQVKQNIKPLVVNLIIQAQLIKLGLMNVLHKVGQLGQQLLITVQQTLQRVLALLKQGK